MLSSSHRLKGCASTPSRTPNRCGVMCGCAHGKTKSRRFLPDTTHDHRMCKHRANNCITRATSHRSLARPPSRPLPRRLPVPLVALSALPSAPLLAILTRLVSSPLCVPRRLVLSSSPSSPSSSSSPSSPSTNSFLISVERQVDKKHALAVSWLCSHT